MYNAYLQVAICETSARLFDPQFSLYQLKTKYIPLIFQHVQIQVEVKP